MRYSFLWLLFVATFAVAQQPFVYRFKMADARYKPVMADSAIKVLKARLLKKDLKDFSVELVAGKNEIRIESATALDTSYILHWLIKPNEIAIFSTFDYDQTVAILSKQKAGNRLLATFSSLINPADIQPANYQNAWIGSIALKDTPQFNKFQKELTPILKNTLGFAYQAPDEFSVKEALMLVYALRKKAPGFQLNPYMEKVKAIKDERGRPAVSFHFNPVGTALFAQTTRENINKFVALAIDDAVYWAPKVMNEIPGGDIVIAGTFTEQEVQHFANMLCYPSLPLKLQLLQ